MKNIKKILSENFQFFFVLIFSVYLNRHVFVMNLKLKFSNNLAHTVNDTISLNCAVSSKPDLLP